MFRDRLDTLRDLFYEAPSEDIWSVLCALFEQGHSAPEVALDYANKHLEGWPDALRIAPETWLDALAQSLRPPALPTISERERPALTSGWVSAYTPVGWPLVRHVLVQEYGGADLVRVLASPHMAKVTTLSLFAVPLPTHALGAIFASHHLSKVRALYLDATRLGVQGARALAASPMAASIEDISLHGTGIGAEGIGALMRSERLSDPVKAMVEDQLRL